jgi:hypothetical protein
VADGVVADGVVVEVAMRLSQPDPACAAGAPQMEAPGCAAAAAARATSCASMASCIAAKRSVLRSSAFSWFSMIT